MSKHGGQGELVVYNEASYLSRAHSRAPSRTERWSATQPRRMSCTLHLVHHRCAKQPLSPPITISNERDREIVQETSHVALTLVDPLSPFLLHHNIEISEF